MREFESKAVLVTGGAGVIGSITARLFLEQGASVMLADLDAGRLDEVAATLDAGNRVATVAGDLSDPVAALEAVDSTIRAFGKLDVLFDNAGIAGAVAPVHELAIEDWDSIVAANLRSMFLVLKFASAHMADAGRGGAIVTMGSSMAGWDVLSGGAGYVSTKHAVVGLTKAAALDLARYGIRVNSVCPGVIETTLGVPGLGSDGDGASAVQQFADRIPLRRIGQPEDVAEVVLFLASDRARHVNGAAWLIDGGQTMQSFSNGPDEGCYPKEG